jgi:hypothetical protein
MFNIYWTIDYVQDTKKQFVNNTVTNQEIRNGLLEFVEKQRELTKIIVKNSELITRESMNGLFPPNICKQ